MIHGQYGRVGMAAFGDDNDYLKINITTIVFRRERCSEARENRLEIWNNHSESYQTAFVPSIHFSNRDRNPDAAW